MPPIGVPVCLTEKTKGCQRGGEYLARIREPAGLSGPIPMPISAAATTATGHAEAVPANARPRAAANKETWQVRMAP